MSFTEDEVAYLRSQRMARLATVASDGQPDVVPVGFEFDGTHLFVGGIDPVNTPLRTCASRPPSPGASTFKGDRSPTTGRSLPGARSTRPSPIRTPEARVSPPHRRAGGTHELRHDRRHPRSPSARHRRPRRPVDPEAHGQPRSPYGKGDGQRRVVTTIGRKSGTERTTAVMCFPGEDGSWLIVASASGAAKNPAWYYNVAAHPDKVQIERLGRKTAVTAEQLHGPAREQAWQQITTAQPRFGNYQQSTDRELPVIRLVPRLD